MRVGGADRSICLLLNQHGFLMTSSMRLTYVVHAAPADAGISSCLQTVFSLTFPGVSHSELVASFADYAADGFLDNLVSADLIKFS